MDSSYEYEAEDALLARLAPTLNGMLGGALVVWEFTASFMSDGHWVSRMDYTLEGEDRKAMKSLLMEGRGSKISMTHPMRPRVFIGSKYMAILRAGLIMMELESPDPGERVI